jgi:hypothetical protein
VAGGFVVVKVAPQKKREKSKPGYDPHRVAINNKRRIEWTNNYIPKYPYSYDGADDDQWGDCDLGIHD